MEGTWEQLGTNRGMNLFKELGKNLFKKMRKKLRRNGKEPRKKLGTEQEYIIETGEGRNCEVNNMFLLTSAH